MNELNFAQALVTELFNDESGNLKNKVAFNIGGTEFSYGLFTQATIDYYYYFQQKGVVEASVVGVSASKPMTQQAMFMALVLHGCTSFRLDVVAEEFKDFINPTHIFIVPFENNVTYEQFIGGNAFIDIIKHPDSGVLTKEGASNLLPNFSSCNEGEKICIYKATSGTTGRSNLVPLTYRTMSERTSPSIISDCTSPVHIGFNPISVIYILSIFRNLRRFGETIISKNVKFIHKKSRSIIAAPYTALEICKLFPPVSDRLQVLQLGGGKINQNKIIDLLENYFHKVVDSYGCTESGHIMKTIYTLDDDKLKVSQKISGGVEIQAPKGSSVEDSGEIGFRTRSMAPGYIGDTASTANFFRNGWFYSGDQGYMDNQSVLHIVGRDSDIVNL
ncbi:MAG: AMP-binding protein, partial [Gammaproteobacteria bacterium]|nr:AMP-binding protein [Gammaproteobacteria bacterium]